MNLMRRSTRLLTACAASLSAFVPCGAVSAATYYVDSVYGKDSNAGTSPSLAFQTLARVSSPALHLNPGDVVKLTSGQTFVGSISLDNTEGGTPSNLITITSTGPSPATIQVPDGQNGISGVCGGIAITNLNFTGNTISYTDLSVVGVDSSNRMQVVSAAHPFQPSQKNEKLVITGDKVTWNPGYFPIYSVDSNHVATLDQSHKLMAANPLTATGGIGTAYHSGAAISFYADREYDTLNISNISISGFCNGITLGSWDDTTAPNPTLQGYKNVTMRNINCSNLGGSGVNTYDNYSYPYPNFTLTNSTFTNCGVGINLQGVDTGLVQNCSSLHCGNPGADFSAFGAWCSRNVLFKYCVAAYTNSPWHDSEGYDLDGGCINCTIDHCLSYMNGDCGIMLCDCPSSVTPAWNNYVTDCSVQNCKIQYCISVNDGRKTLATTSNGPSHYGIGLCAWGESGASNLPFGIKNCKVTNNLAILSVDDNRSTTDGTCNGLYWASAWPDANKGQLVGDSFTNNVAYVEGNSGIFAQIQAPTSDQAGCGFSGNLFRAANGLTPTWQTVVTNADWTKNTSTYSTFGAFDSALNSGVASINPRSFPSIADTDIAALEQITTPSQIASTQMFKNLALIQDGDHTLAPLNAGGLRLDDAGWGNTDGTCVDVYTATGYQNQVWTFVGQGNEIYTIVSKYAGLNLDVAAAGTANGTAIDLWQDNNGDNQKWLVTLDNGGYRLTPVSAPLSVLDSGGNAAPGSYVCLWQSMVGNNNQVWAIN